MIDENCARRIKAKTCLDNCGLCPVAQTATKNRYP
jgi:hypothetical protein